MRKTFESENKIILTELEPYETDCFYTNQVILLNMGDHATHRIRDGFDEIPEIWRISELSMLDTRKGENVEIKAEFLYRAMEHQGDNYMPQRTLITMQNAEKTSEDRRIILYDKNGAIEEDKVVVASLVKKSRFGYGTITYDLNPQTGNYVSEAEEIYHGQITNDGILERVNMLAAQSERLAAENDMVL